MKKITFSNDTNNNNEMMEINNESRNKFHIPFDMDDFNSVNDSVGGELLNKKENLKKGKNTGKKGKNNKNKKNKNNNANVNNINDGINLDEDNEFQVTGISKNEIKNEENKEKEQKKDKTDSNEEEYKFTDENLDIKEESKKSKASRSIKNSKNSQQQKEILQR